MPKVAAIQFAPKFKDHLGNLRRAAALVAQAAQGGAQLIVLPELVTSGYGFMSKAEAEPFTEVITTFDAGRVHAGQYPPGVAISPSMDIMYALAWKYKVHVAWGIAEKDIGTGELFNSQVLMCPDGRYESMRKINRWGNDFLWSRPGRANPPIMSCVFSDGVKKVGLLICRDIRDKFDDNWDSFYEKGDADIVAYSANWGDGGFPATAWMDFVKDNGVTLIVSNRYGYEIPNDFGEGGSCVIQLPDNVTCAGLVWKQDCIIYADV
jgi:predicted amidohydrolase